MTTQDILLKLLPFTHKVNNSVIFTFNLSFGDWIVTIIELVLLLIFFGALLQLILSYRKDNKGIELLERELGVLKERGFEYYNDFLEHLKQNKRIYHLWNEFNESLIRRENSLENSLDADYFFNEKTLASHVGSKFYSAISGILLGIGLLGTFFALYVALVELNLEGNNLKESIRHFIGMVGVKFTASVWGILLSVAYTFIEKGLEGRLNNKIQHLQDNIDEIFKRQTAEQNLFNIAEESKQQTRALNSLAETLTQKISEEFNPIISQMNTHLQQMPESISTAIGESLKEPLSVLSQNAKISIESQSDNLGKLVQTFIKKIEDATGDQTKNIQSLISYTTQKLTQLIDNLNQTNQQMVTYQQKQDEQVTLAIEKMQLTLDEIISKLARDVSKTFSDQQKEFQHQHKTIVEENNIIISKMQDLLSDLSKQSNSQKEGTKKIKNDFEDMQKRLNESNKKLFEEIEARNNKILDDMTQNIAKIEYVIDVSSKKLLKLPDILKTFETGSQHLQTFAEIMQNATKEFNETTVKINELQSSLNNQLDKVDNVADNLNKISESTLQYINNAKISIEEIRSVYGTVINDNKENLEEFREKMLEWIESLEQQTHKVMHGSLKEISAALENFAGTLGKYAEMLSYKIDEFEDILENIDDKLSK